MHAISEMFKYCKTANDSVQDIIANLASEASRYFILLAITQWLYMHVIYRWTALDLTFPMTLFYPARYQPDGHQFAIFSCR